MKKHLPNILTLLNLCCGSLSIIFSSTPEMHLWAAWLILLAMVFDFSDGLLARALKVSSELGKELDSLSDLVSFGLAPSVLILQTISERTGYIPGYAYLLLLIPLLSAFRLARFNLDTRQQVHFIGLPTPANALFLLSLVMMQHQHFLPAGIEPILNNPLALTIAAILPAFLLNAPIPLMSLKIYAANKQLTIIQLGLGLSAVLLFIWILWLAVPLILLIYLLLSVVFRKAFS